VNVLRGKVNLREDSGIAMLDFSKLPILRIKYCFPPLSPRLSIPLISILSIDNTRLTHKGMDIFEKPHNVSVCLCKKLKFKIA